MEDKIEELIVKVESGDDDYYSREQVVEMLYELIEKEQTWTRWCEICQQTSTFSESNPYGTCQCS